jgi:hypothetical protein
MLPVIGRVRCRTRNVAKAWRNIGFSAVSMRASICGLQLIIGQATALSPHRGRHWLCVIGYQVMIAVKLDQPVAAAGSTFQRHGA